MVRVTGGMRKCVGLRVPTKGTAPTPPINPTLKRRNMGVMRFAGRFGTEATSRKSLVVPMMVAICGSEDFDFVAGAPPTTILVGGTYGVRSNSNMPGGAGITAVAGTRIERVTRVGVPSLGTTSMRTTRDVVTKAYHSVNMIMRSWSKSCGSCVMKCGRPAFSNILKKRDTRDSVI